jgi:hypothetical protein
VLRYLNSQNNLPLLCAGEFNDFLKQQEQLGVNSRSEFQIENLETV